MNEVKINTMLKKIKNLKSQSHQLQIIADHRAKEVVHLISEQFPKQFNFMSGKLAYSDKNVVHVKARKLVFKAGKLMMVAVAAANVDPNDLMGYDGQIMTIDDAISVFRYFDEDDDCSTADADNNHYLNNTSDPLVVMTEGGNVSPLSWEDILNEADCLKKYLKTGEC